MFNMSDLLGALTQSGLTGSTNQRMRNALSAGGKAPESLLSGLLGGLSGGGLGDVDLIYVPEPSSLAMLAIALASMLPIRARRRR